MFQVKCGLSKITRTKVLRRQSGELRLFLGLLQGNGSAPTIAEQWIQLRHEIENSTDNWCTLALKALRNIHQR